MTSRLSFPVRLTYLSLVIFMDRMHILPFVQADIVLHV